MKKTLLSLACLLGSLFTNAQVGEALSFDGSNDYVMTNSNITHGNQFTYEAWIKPMSANQWGGIMTTSSLASQSQWVQITLNSAGALRAEIVDDSGNNKWYEGNTSLLGAWHHIAVSFDGTNLIFYVDGNVETTSAINNGNLGTMTINSQLNIGAERNHNAFYSGDIDEVRVWNIVRSQCEINSYKNCEISSTATGLITNYHFNQGLSANVNTTESTLLDASGNLNTGILNNFALNGATSNWIAPGGVISGNTTVSVCPTASALNFDGVDDYISVSSGMASMNEVTIEGWIRPESIGYFNAILNNDNWSTGFMHFQLTPTGQLGFSLNGNTPTDQVTSMVFTPNQWYHVAAVYSSINNYLKFYVNGGLVNTFYYSNTVATAANAPFSIGGWNNQRFFDGSIDELRVWSTARTQCEIYSYMNCEIPTNTSNLVANYHFNQGFPADVNTAETTLTDASGNAITGTLTNFALSGSSSNWIAPGGVISGSVTPAVCNLAAALNFDGVNDYVSVNNSALLNMTNAITIEAWVKTTGSPTGEQYIISKSDDSYYMALNVGGNVGRASFFMNGVSSGWLYSNATNINDNNWHHVASSYDGTTIKIYIDGVFDNSVSASGTIQTGVNNVNFGCRNNSLFLQGSLDEARIWNVARTQCEINTYLNCEIPSVETGLVANYHFNQGVDAGVNSTLTMLIDASGNANTGTLNNFGLTGTTSNWVAPGAVVSGFSTTAVCPLAAAINFDGSNDGVDLGNSINIILDPLNTITVEAWVNPSTTTWLGVIAGNYNTASSGMQFLLRRDGDQYAFWVDAGNGFQVVNSGGSTVSVGSWQHVAGVWDGSELRIYIDGVLKATTTGVNGSSFAASSNNVWLGYNNVNESFMGSIDETRIWSVARTSCEINTYMNSEISNPMTGLLVNYHFNQGFSAYSNPTETTLIDASGNGYNGTLNNFGLNGSVSNWIAPGGVVSGYTTTLAPPVVTVNSGTICAGESFTMMPSGGVTYTFSNGSSVATPTADATYSVSGTDANGCVSNVDAISSVTVNALPTIVVNSGTICAGNSFTMVPTGATTYTFSNGTDVVMPTIDATYSVSGTDANGCVSSTDAISSVTVNALPTISVNSGSICTGQSFTMVPTGATTYTFSNGTDVVMPSIDATYSVSGTNANGCVSNMDAISSITVNALPTIMASTSNTLLCTGEAATLTVNGSATSYTWNTNESTTNIVVTPTMATTYTVDGTDANGCVNTTTILQDVNACTGIASLNGNATSLNVYPNPNIGLFIIELNTNSLVSITNALGQVILTETIEAGKHNLDIQNQATGVYFVKVIQQDKQHIIKLIKK